MVSVHAFYFGDQTSNPADNVVIFLNYYMKKRRLKNLKRGRVWPAKTKLGHRSKMIMLKNDKTNVFYSLISVLLNSEHFLFYFFT